MEADVICVMRVVALVVNNHLKSPEEVEECSVFISIDFGEQRMKLVFAMEKLYELEKTVKKEMGILKELS